ncbi:MAG TPA: hypothetical protein VMV40_08760 [Acidiferrobacter sp.]|nr:hypothetical protein [Acidiferrobacter sp.]
MDIEEARLKGVDLRGFREKLWDESVKILASHLFMKKRIQKKGYGVLRECWVCSKSGNQLREVIDSVADVLVCEYGIKIETQSVIKSIVRQPGFLTPKEVRYTNEIQGKTIVAYRGCQGPEDDGYCWTLAKDIAEFFARRQNGRIVTAHVTADAWLDTQEHEVIILSPEQVHVVAVELPTIGGCMDWDNRPTILPTQNIISPGPL